jgi:galactokinase
MSASLQTAVIQEFRARFGGDPTLLVRAPGRVNLIGEHTDYNDGFVLPMAIDRAVVVALRPRQDTLIHAYSLDFAEEGVFDLNRWEKLKVGWSLYVQGVAWSLDEKGYVLGGWEGVIKGDVPVGAGLSSSAALELAIARAFASVTPFDWDAAQMAKVGQYAENKWVGVNCGIMDQMISAAGEEGHALLIDCRSLATRAVPLPAGTVAVILDTTTRRGLVDSAYNERRKQCEVAARFFQVDKLRDVDVETFHRRAHMLDTLTRKRARHVITENERTLYAAEVMERGDAEALGLLMNASHDSLRDDFEVTNAALNAIVDAARAQKGCFGARMTGAGFGGCAVALVEEKHAAKFAQETTAAYEAKSGLNANVYICKPMQGASVVAL